jgi:methionine synthase II (cobalamin-independent)
VTLATGIGSYPGTTAGDYDEAVRVVLGVVPGLPHLPELPGRGLTAGMIGRALAMITELGADLQPEGWRLIDRPGVDQRRARSLLAQDLDIVEQQSQEYAGLFKVQVTGAWTLAASVEAPKGDRVLRDHGARRELGEALAEGIVAHLSDVRRRIPGAELLLQLDEPSLPAVLAGRVPTASGLHSHRSVDPQEAGLALQRVIGLARDAGVDTVVHCCAAEPPLDLIRSAGAAGVSVDLDRLSPGDLDNVAELLEAGSWVFLGVVPTTRPEDPPNAKQVTERLTRLLDMFTLEPTERLVVTPACGLAGADPAWARMALEICREAAHNLDQ